MSRLGRSDKRPSTHTKCVYVSVTVFHKLDWTSSRDRLEKCRRTDIVQDFVSFCRRWAQSSTAWRASSGTQTFLHVNLWLWDTALVLGELLYCRLYFEYFTLDNLQLTNIYWIQGVTVVVPASLMFDVAWIWTNNQSCPTNWESKTRLISLSSILFSFL